MSIITGPAIDVRVVDEGVEGDDASAHSGGPEGDDDESDDEHESDGSDGRVHVEPAVANEWAAAAAVAAVRHDGAPDVRPNGAVYVRDRHIGRISYVHDPTSRMFVYCRLHGCYKCIAFSKNPYQSGAAKWLAAGLAADVGSKADHTRSFLDFVLHP